MRKRNNVLLVVSAIFIGLSLLSGCAKAADDSAIFVQDGLIEGVRIEAAKLGKVLSISQFDRQAKDFKYSVLVGRLGEPHVTAFIKSCELAIDMDWLGKQGFQIISKKTGNRVATLVTGATDVGVLYGLLDLPLQTEYLGFNTVNEYLATTPSRRGRPFFQLRRGRFSDRANFNMKDASRSMMLYEYDKWPEVFENEEQKRAIVEKMRPNRESFERLYKDSEKYGAAVYLWVYEPTFQVYSERFYKAHPQADARDNRGYLDPNAEIVKTIIREKYRQIWRRYPKLGGVYLSFKNGGQSFLTPGKTTKKTHNSYKCAAEYIKIIESAMREYNPNARVIVRQWKLHKSGLNLTKLSKILPPSVRYGCKATCPPGNDYLWHDLLTPYLKNIPQLFINGLSTSNTDGPNDVCSHLCYDGPKLKRRAIKFARYTNYGAWEGDTERTSYRKSTLMELLNTPARRARVRIGWDPHTVDPDKLLESHGKRMFGKEAGRHFFLALKDIWKVTDAMVFRPEWTDGRAWTGQLHVYHFFPWKKTGYNTGVQQPKKLINITPAGMEKFRKRLDIREAVALAEFAESELEKALKCKPRNKERLELYFRAAKGTAALARAWRNYHLGLLYHNLAKNSPKDSRSAEWRQKSAGHMAATLPDLWVYRNGFFDFYPEIRDRSVYRGKHPKLYLSFVTQEIQDGYHQVVLAAKVKKFKQLWRLSSYKQAMPTYSEPAAKPTASGKTLSVANITDGKLPPLISLNVLPELNLIFNADLTGGGIVKIAERTWMDRSKRDPVVKHKGYSYNFGIADVDVLLDGKSIGRITEYGEQYTEGHTRSWIRYIELPPAGKGKHSLTLRSRGRTGMELQRITLYAKGNPVVVASGEKVKESFSADPKWKTKRSDNSRMKMHHDKKEGVLKFDLWREKSQYAIFHTSLPAVRSEPICAEFDLRIDSAARKAWGTVGFLSASLERTFGLHLYVENSESIAANPTKAKLKPQRWYRVKLQRKNDVITVTIKDKAGGKPVEYSHSTDRLPECGWAAFGVTNRSGSSKTAGPIKITLDNLNISFSK